MTSQQHPGGAPRFLRVPEFATLFGTTTATVRRWIRAGMPASRPDRRWLVPVHAATAWIETGLRRSAGGLQ